MFAPIFLVKIGGEVITHTDVDAVLAACLEGKGVHPVAVARQHVNVMKLK